MKLVAPCALALLLSAVVALPSQASPSHALTTDTSLDGTPLGNNWGCNTPEGIDKAKACQATCKSTHDAKRKACRDAGRSCEQSCSGKGQKDCRDSCKAEQKACMAPLSQEAESCKQACVTSTPGCHYR